MAQATDQQINLQMSIEEALTLKQGIEHLLSLFPDEYAPNIKEAEYFNLRLTEHIKAQMGIQQKSSPASRLPHPGRAE